MKTNETPLWREPIQPGCFMVGQRHPHSLLQCNTYLRTFESRGRSPIHWCVDPGSQLDYPVIRRNLRGHIGDLSAIQLFSINHQDPDVVGNLVYLTRENPDLAGLMTQDTWRLVRHLDVRPKTLYFADSVGHKKFTLPVDHRIRAVPTPFCHFRGAVAYYDLENQVLFSGDLFAGLNKPGRVQLYGEEEDWPGIAQFHQIYMPNRAAVAFAIRQVRALRPAVKIIAPQHGFVLQGDFMHTVMDRLEKLRVGMDLLSKELDVRYLKAYREVVHEVIDAATVILGRHVVMDRLRRLPRHNALHRYLRITRDDVELVRKGITALPLLVEALMEVLQVPEFAALLKSTVLEGCIKRKAPLPQLGIGVEGAVS